MLASGAPTWHIHSMTDALSGSPMSSHLIQSCGNSSTLGQGCATTCMCNEVARVGTTFAWVGMARCALLANNAGLTRLRLDAETGTVTPGLGHRAAPPIEGDHDVTHESNACGDGQEVGWADHCRMRHRERGCCAQVGATSIHGNRRQGTKDSKQNRSSYRFLRSSELSIARPQRSSGVIAARSPAHISSGSVHSEIAPTFFS